MADLPAPLLAATAGIGPGKAASLPAARNAQEAERVAQDFEAQFLAQMLEHMFSGVRADGPFGGGHAEEMFRALLLQEYGKVMAKAGGVGLADSVKREMLRAQEVMK